MARSLSIALVSTEVTPFAETGGLGDVMNYYGAALKNLGMKPYFIMPLYRRIPASLTEDTGLTFSVPLGPDLIKVKIKKGKHPKDVPVYFIDIPEFFDREHLYGDKLTDYPDNSSRFLTFSRATIELIKTLKLPCDIIHANDWQTAFVPFFLKSIYKDDPYFSSTRSVFAIHNIGYQGYFTYQDFLLTGLDAAYFSPPLLEFYGKLNFLKAGIVSADSVITVSPTYASEVLTSHLGYGLQGVLEGRRDRFVGILNGIDHNEWNPSADPLLPASYSEKNLKGKALCKKALQEHMKLPADPSIPLFGIVSRLVDQKGIDLLVNLFPLLAEREMQWVVLGTGDPSIEKSLREFSKLYPDKMAFCAGFDTQLPHLIQAGADFILMPSRYEPCGLNQIYAQRYGAIPIVTATGGLVDTVVDLKAGVRKGTGIVFTSATAESLLEALNRALDLYRDEKALDRLRKKIMKKDFSWIQSGPLYIKLYEDILKTPQTPLPSKV